MKLTRIQQHALFSVWDRPNLFPGASHAHGNTMNALERKGLIVRDGNRWRMTDAGRAALEVE